MKKQIIAAAAIALGATSILGASAQADGPMTLAEILLSDSADDVDGFDTNQNDFDIVTQALLATNGLNGLATAASDPDAELTVFLPTDKAFRILVEDLGLGSIKDESDLFDAIVATVGAPAVSDILKYHVVGGVADSSVVATLGGVDVPTLLDGATFQVQFKGKKQIRLVDAGGPGRDPIVRAVDIMGSNGVAHVIDRVLIPG